MGSVKAVEEQPPFVGLDVQFGDGTAVPVADQQMGVVGPHEARRAAQTGCYPIDLVAVNHGRFRTRGVRIDLPGHEQRDEKRHHGKQVPSHRLVCSVG